MKRIALTLCVASTILFGCNSTDKKESSGTDSTKMDTASTAEKKWIPVDSAMMNKAWAESMALGEPHKVMAKTAGTWNADVTMWMGEGEAPMKSTSTSVNTLLYGGLYEQSKHSGTMMGAPFEGMSLMAYDNTLKEFVSTWIDNMGSGILVMKGNWDAGSNTINLAGTYRNPANGLDCNMREVFKIVDDNNHTLEMYGPDPKTGKEMKSMEIKYTRKK